jgi:hypothetical protein
MRPIILYRDDVDWRQESSAASQYFETTKSRVLLKKDDIVIPRFSALPFYREQEHDASLIGARLINTYQQHLYCADLQNYYQDLQEHTPKLHYDLASLPENGGPFVLKGETNSKKFLWDTHMFAKDKRAAIEVHSRLEQDGLLAYQKICIRDYVPLETFFTAFRGLPVTREYRFFCYRKKVLSGGFYWSNHYEDLVEQGVKLDPREVPAEFLRNVLNKIQSSTNGSPPVFYVVDVAKTQSGEWIVIELNDGSMSGLSMNDPNVLYRNLHNALWHENLFIRPIDEDSTYVL